MPDAADEAMRDLVRTREDAVIMQRQARQRLAALLLRNDVRYAGKTAWTAAHRRWIAQLKLPAQPQQIAFEEYVQAVNEATARIERLEQAIATERGHWRWLPVAHALEAFRGIQVIHATRIMAERPRSPSTCLLRASCRGGARCSTRHFIRLSITAFMIGLTVARSSSPLMEYSFHSSSESKVPMR